MGGMGPPPKPSAQRRNAQVSMTRLPAKGRTGKSPVWPLIDDVATEARLELAERTVERLTDELEYGDLTGAARARVQRKLDAAEETVAILGKRLAVQRELERKLWRDLWRTPQAVAWERLSWTRDVAQYVRWKVLAELGDLDAAKEARQLSDRLGLTPLAMLRLRWEIVTEEEAAATQRRRTRATASPAPAAAEQAATADPRSVLRVV